MVVKAHSGHMATADFVAQAIERAVEKSNMPKVVSDNGHNKYPEINESVLEGCLGLRPAYIKLRVPNNHQ
ncbi:hypothetical protein B4Q10_01350 [Acinetobacter baumannii]|nr:hypothetical protein B4Q10_01350 [Acinetobacter baumannii]